jgi:uncharacterized OsmC-like protein
MSDQHTTIGIDAHAEGPRTTTVETDAGAFVVGEPASPLEHLLGSLAACLNVIGHLVAKDHGIVLRSLDVTVEGDIDTARYKGESTTSRAGFEAIRVRVLVEATADESALTTWLEATEARCPVADNLGAGTDLTTTLEVV